MSVVLVLCLIVGLSGCFFGRDENYIHSAKHLVQNQLVISGEATFNEAEVCITGANDDSNYSYDHIYAYCYFEDEIEEMKKYNNFGQPKED